MYKKNYLFLITLVCYCTFLFIGCQTMYDAGDGMMYGGVGAYNEGVEKEHQKTQEFGFFATLIGAGLKFFGWLGGGRQQGTARPLPEVAVAQPKDSADQSNDISDGDVIILAELPVSNDINTTVSQSTWFETAKINEPANSSSITQSSDQNIGNPQVKSVVNSARVPTQRRDPRQGNYYVNQDRQLTGRNNSPANPQTGNTGSRAGRADAEPGYGQGTQQATARPAPSNVSNQSSQLPNTARSALAPNPPASVQQGSTIVAQNPQAQATTIVQFIPQPSHNQRNQPTQSQTEQGTSPRVEQIQPNQTQTTTNVGLNNSYRQKVKPQSFDKEVEVDIDFIRYIDFMGSCASKHNLEIKVTGDGFRKEGVTLTNTVVNPANASNHLVGHAIDINIEYNGKWYNSSYLNNFDTLPEPIKSFIIECKNYGMRWGGDFVKIDSVHFDSGLNINNQTEWRRLYNIYQDR